MKEQQKQIFLSEIQDPMTSRKGFIDLNVPYNSSNRQLRVQQLELLIQLGFDGIAWNHFILSKSFGPSQNCFIEKIPLNELSSGSTGQLTLNNRNFVQYSRLTVLLDDFSQTNLFNANNPNPILKSYDIVAVQPTNEKIFHECCTTLDLDIITFDLSQKLDYKLKKTPLQAAITRGIYFELNISAALSDSNSRKFFLSNALAIVEGTNGRNLIISSGAQKLFHLRGPYDLMNLGTLMGLNFAVAQQALSSACHSVIFHGLTRNTYRGVIQVTNKNEVPSWTIPSLEMQNVPTEEELKQEEEKMEIEEKQLKEEQEKKTQQLRKLQQQQSQLQQNQKQFNKKDSKQGQQKKFNQKRKKE